MSIGERIRHTRKARGLSQESLARGADISLNVVGKIENGIIRDPHISTLRGIAAALEVDIAELLGESAPKAQSRSSHEADEVSEEERLAAEVSWQAEFEELGEELASRWEDELEDKLAHADENPPAFFDWVEEVRRVERAYLDKLVSTYMASGDRLAAVIGVAPFLGRRRDFWRRIEAATLTRPQDQEQLQKIAEEARAEEAARLAA